MKVEFNKTIKSLKKIQAEMRLEMKDSACHTNLRGKPRQHRERNAREMPGVGDQVGELNTSLKENFKPKNIQSQNSQKTWDTMKR